MTNNTNDKTTFENIPEDSGHIRVFMYSCEECGCVLTENAKSRITITTRKEHQCPACKKWGTLYGRF